MPSERDVQAWTDILDNARLALEFAAGLDEEAFAADAKSFYAATRCLEIISEAARRLGATERERFGDLPWKAITGAGNVYRPTMTMYCRPWSGPRSSAACRN